jgi:hypothetical protein
MGGFWFCVCRWMAVHLKHGTGGDADDRDVIKDGFGRPCLFGGFENINHVFKYPGVWGSASSKYRGSDRFFIQSAVA